MEFAAVSRLPAKQRLEEAHGGGNDKGAIPTGAERAVLLAVFLLAMILENIGDDFRVFAGALFNERQEGQDDDDAALALMQGKVEQRQRFAHSGRSGQCV